MTVNSPRKVTLFVNPRFGTRSWVKLWVNEWLDGTTRFEMADFQRAFWIDLLAMAGRSRFPGVVCAGVIEGKYVGYPLTKFQALMGELFDVEATLRLFEKTGKIKLEVTSEGPVRLFKIELVNWAKYQSEYNRQKPYRINKKARELQDSDTKSYTQGNTIEGDKKENRSRVDKKNHCARPSLEDVTLYCQERKNQVDPQQWFDYYSANGWKVGRNQMKDWRAAVRTWERNSNGKQQVSASAARSDRSKRNIIDGITADARRRNASLQSELEIGAGSETSRRD